MSHLKSKFLLLLFTLGLPLLAFSVAWAAINRLDDGLRSQLRRDHPNIPERTLAQITVKKLTDDGQFSPGAELPRIYSHLQIIQTVAIIAGIVGLVLIGAIYTAGVATRTRRDLLLRLFRPGVFVTLCLVGLLTVVPAFALAGAFYYYGLIDSGKEGAGVYSIAIVIGGVLAVVAVARALFSMRHTPELPLVARGVSREEQSGIWTIVQEVCDELHTTSPDNLVLGLEPTFFVTEAPVVLPERKLRGRTLFLSLALSRVLTPLELRAIIGHEIAHFIGDDTKFSQQFFPVYRGTLIALSHLSRHKTQILSVVPRHLLFMILALALALPLFPAATFLNFFFESFLVSEKNLSRIRETAADAVGARVGGTVNLATALVKTSAYVGAWRTIIEDVRYNNEELQGETNLSLPFHAQAALLASEVIAKAGDKQVSHPFDSHPALAVRLQSLQTNLPILLPLTTVPSFDHSAAALIRGLTALEEEQTSTLRKRVRQV